MLEHQTEFGITKVMYYKLVDMYAPYQNEELEHDIPFLKDIEHEQLYLLSYKQNTKTYRWRLVFTIGDKDFVMEQFFF